MDTSSYVGDLEVMCMKVLLYDMAIRNISCKRHLEKPNGKKIDKVSVAIKKAQGKNKQVIKPLHLSKSNIPNVGLQEL